MPPAGSQQQILRTIDFWQLSRAAQQQVPGPSVQLLDFLAHHPYCPVPHRPACPVLCAPNVGHRRIPEEHRFNAVWGEGGVICTP